MSVHSSLFHSSLILYRMKKFMRILTWVVAVAIVLIAVYIMANRLGLVDSLGFGAGAYYYADIPNYKEIDKNAYHNTVPTWLCIILFLAWGFLMYRLWCWLDSRNNRSDKK